MKASTYKLLVIIFSMIILIGGSLLLYRHLAAEVAPQSGRADPTEQSTTLAPDFTVQDSSDGVWNLSDFRGSPVVLNFWSSHCNPCKQEMPVFRSAWEQYGDQVEFMMVNLTDGFNDTFESAMKLVTEEDYRFPVYFDTQGSAAAAFQVTGMPMTFFIDARGSVVSFHMGAISPEKLESGIQSILD